MTEVKVKKSVRIDLDLERRIDLARGQVPFERWARDLFLAAVGKSEDAKNLQRPSEEGHDPFGDR